MSKQWEEISQRAREPHTAGPACSAHVEWRVVHHLGTTSSRPYLCFSGFKRKRQRREYKHTLIYTLPF